MPEYWFRSVQCTLIFWSNPGEGANFLAVTSGTLHWSSFFTADIPCANDYSHMLSLKKSHVESAKPPSQNIG